MAKLNKAQLLAVLEDMKKTIEADDSFEGGINYTALEEGLDRGEFHVTGAYRVDNSMGQGGMRLLS